jgi:hypothetical protein
MVHTNPEFETSNLILDFEFDQHLESHKHVINIIMWFRDMGCYTLSVGTVSVIVMYNQYFIAEGWLMTAGRGQRRYR